MLNLIQPPPIYTIIVGQGGCGKTQAVEFVANKLQQLTGRESVITEEPSRKNRQSIFAAKATRTKSGLQIVEMFYADRRDEVIKPQILPAKKSGKNSVSNRGYPCTRAYEGGGEGVMDKEIDRVHKQKLGTFFADLVIYLQLSNPEIGLKRKPSFDGDSFDAEKMEYHWRVKGKYDEMANSQRPEFWITIDADPPIVKVRQQLDVNLREYLKLVNR